MLKTHIIIIILFCSTFHNISHAQEGFDDEQIHKIVIQVNKDDLKIQSEVLTNIVNISKHYGIDNVAIEVVAYGKGIDFLTDKSPFVKRIESLMMQEVKFTACGNTIRTLNHSHKKNIRLIDNVEVVEYGIPRIVLLQEHGYAYISP